MPVLSLVLHRLSCVMSCPPPEAETVAELALRLAFDHRHDGITYGGCGAPCLRGELLKSRTLDEGSMAPACLEAQKDATWGNLNLYSMALTYNGGVVHHCTKKIGSLMASSCETEGFATAKSGEMVETARAALRALGAPQLQPTPIGSDNLSDVHIGNRSGAASRAKHFLQRYFIFQQRLRRGAVSLYHLPDPANTSDFLTKWVNATKLRRSLDYLTNRQNRVGGNLARGGQT